MEAIIKKVVEGRGVSASVEDIMTLLESCKPYLIGLAAALVALIALLVAAAFVKKKVIKGAMRFQGVCAFLLVVTIIVNQLCTGPMFSLLNLSMGATGEGMTEETEAESIEIANQIAQEGIVLLKNQDNVLPLSSDVKKVNVFGWASTNPIYGGTGSGEFADTSAMVSLLQGLENAGYEVNQDIVSFYEKEEDTRPEIGMYIQNWTNPEAKMKDYDKKKIFENAKDFSDTAILVISRSGGENADLPMSITDENSIAQAATTGHGVRYTSQKDDIDPSKTYLELTKRETDLVERVNQEFQNVVVIINSANTMELGWVDAYENIKAVVWCAGAGQSGFNALGEVLNGTVNPSGRTVDTYVYDLLATPVANNIGAFAYDNVQDLVNADDSTNYSAYFVNYNEGIYIGYKFYETAAAEGIIDYDAVVQYPFGYGLSYTNFRQELKSVEESKGTVTVKVSVTNTGSVAGKNVVEVYYTPPYYNGGIEKAAVNLIEFGRTDLLEPGASQELTLSFKMEDMASYDEENNRCYVLEHGDYEISIRSDSHTVIDSRTIHQDEDVIYGADNPRSTDKTAATNVFDFAKGDVTYLSRADHFANYEQATAAPENYSMSNEVKTGFISMANYDAAADVKADAVMPTTGAKGTLTLADLAGADYDDAKWEKLLDQMSVEEMSQLITLGGYSTVAVPSVGLDATIETDGPSGLHSNFTELDGTSFPSSVMLASTWNKELAGRKGEAIGKQGMELGISGWYGPAMNIHRSAFSGRNFEYYSEDAVLSGQMAAQEVIGARKSGMQCYIKHFALNDQESQRTGMLTVWSSEQAIREGYLKAFEIAVKEGNTTSVMSSYNYIGNQWAGACDALLNTVLRDEWGFSGVVVTDWYGGYGYMNSDLAIRNGGDRMLTNIATAALKDTTTATAVSSMRTACKNILYSLVNSSLYAGLSMGAAQWQVVLHIFDGIMAALIVVLEAVFALRVIKKKYK